MNSTMKRKQIEIIEASSLYELQDAVNDFLKNTINVENVACYSLEYRYSCIVTYEITT